MKGGGASPVLLLKNAITSTNVILGCPWLHEHEVVPSTWHQCFKYKTPQGETNRIFTNTKPFTTAKAFYAYSKLDLEPSTELRKPAPTPPDQIFLLLMLQSDGVITLGLPIKKPIHSSMRAQHMLKFHLFRYKVVWSSLIQDSPARMPP